MKSKIEDTGLFVNQTEQITGILVLFAIVLRFSVSIIQLVWASFPMIGALIFEMVTYAGIVTLILFNRKRLGVFHIDNFDLFIILIFGSLFRTNIQGEPIAISFIIFGGLGIGTAIIFRREKIELKKFSIMHVFIGGIIGILLSLFNIFVRFGHLNPMIKENILVVATISFIHFITHSAVIEEPIFRGFLLGYLKLRKWNEILICLFQGILFTIVHINLNGSKLFLIMPLLSGIIFGLLTLKYKSITPAIIAHAAYNTMIYIFQPV